MQVKFRFYQWFNRVGYELLYLALCVGDARLEPLERTNRLIRLVAALLQLFLGLPQKSLGKGGIDIPPAVFEFFQPFIQPINRDA